MKDILLACTFSFGLAVLVCLLVGLPISYALGTGLGSATGTLVCVLTYDRKVRLSVAHLPRPSGAWEIGSLAGFEVVPVMHFGDLRIELRHRCDWSQLLPFEGITGDGSAYLANTVLTALEEHRTHACRINGFRMDGQ